MGEHVIKLPDVGEGVAEAELVEWHVKVGDLVREDAVLAAVMTDKATVEIPSPVDGEIIWLGAEIGDTVAIGSPIVRLKVAGEGNVADSQAASAKAEADAPQAETTPKAEPKVEPEAAKPAPAPEKLLVPKPGAAPKPAPAALTTGAPRAAGEKPLASPAVRLRAADAGVDLRQVAGSGPAGRITHEDLDGFIARGPQPAGKATGVAPNTSVEDIKVVGLRRKIAEKMRAVQVAHPAHHLCRGGRRQCAGRFARRAQQGQARRPAEADHSAIPDARNGQGHRRAASVERAVR